MARYTVNSLVPPNANWYLLVKLLQDAGLNVIDVQTSEDMPGKVIVVTPDDVDLTQAQQTTMNNVVTQFDPRPRTARPLYAIYNDLAALTAGQQSAIWGNFSALTNGVEKYLLDAGPNAASIVVLDLMVKSLGLTGAALTAARFRAVTMYVQDNPKYLVNPSFASTVNVPGDMPITQ